MTISQDLAAVEGAIDTLLDHPLGAGHYQVVQSVAGKVYEAYIFGLCLRAAYELHSSPVLRGITGPPTPFIFRGAPGQIHSRARNYGYAEFSLGDQDFEVHTGVEFQGTSKTTHELDVCIMKADHALKCRDFRSLQDPPASSLICGWECKFYAGNLPKVSGRAFVGLLDDMGSKIRLGALCSNSDNPRLRNYFSLQRRPHFHYALTPLSPETEVSFVEQIKLELKKLTST